MKPSENQQVSKTFFDRILNFTQIIAAVMIAFIMLTICVHVVMRYVFNMPQNWVIDVAVILLLYIGILPGAWLLRQEGHVSIEFVLMKLKSERSRDILEIINSTICLAVCAILVVYGILETIKVYELNLIVDMALRPPRWITVIVTPVAFLLFFIQFIRRIRGFYKKSKSGQAA